MQVKLCAPFRKKRVRKVGASAEEVVDRAASSRPHITNLREEVDQACFRRDLYYRLAVTGVAHAGATRERSEYPDWLNRCCSHCRQCPAEVVEPTLQALSTLPIPRQCARVGEHPRACDGAFSSSIIDVPDLQLAPKPMPGARPAVPANAR